MKKFKNKIDISLLIILIMYIIISIMAINSSTYLHNDQSLPTKQALWFGIGFILIIISMILKNNFIFKNAWILYIITNLALLGLLIFATPINNAKCWYQIPGIGTIQPSEFMKIVLIITIASILDNYHKIYSNPTLKEEFFLLLKIGLTLLIPSILTFLQPDTGVVLIYLLITVVMLFVSGIRYRWFIILFSSIFTITIIVLAIYFINTDAFINIFGTDFFLRVDRLLDWSSKSGYQLENGTTAIGTGGLTGMGLNNTPIYFPESQTDFIFPVIANNFGFIGSITLLILILILDLKLILIALRSNILINKFVISGIVGMLIYQQTQNIAMTFGLLPITGITLPFVSYGGSSLLSYMIMLGIVFNISNENNKYTN